MATSSTGCGTSARLNGRSAEAEHRAILRPRAACRTAQVPDHLLMEIPPGDAYDDEDFARYQ